AWVQEVGAPRPTIALHPDTPVNPASVMKLVTTYAALELLGPAYRWKTEAYLDGEHLVLRGTGDPKLNYESFWMLLRSLRGRGLRELRGDVLLDRSYFGPAQYSPFDSDTYRPYNVTPDALLVNFKSLRFTFVPEGDQGVRVYAEPTLPGMELVNRRAARVRARIRAARRDRARHQQVLEQRHGAPALPHARRGARRPSGTRRGSRASD